MTEVTGIGGVFFHSKNPKTLSEWYEKHFGVNSMNSSEVWEQEHGPTVFAPFEEDTDYFGQSDQQFMINFRVADLNALLAQLREDGVQIDDESQEESNGKFAWVYDPEGNKIELWEPKNERS